MSICRECQRECVWFDREGDEGQGCDGDADPCNNFAAYETSEITEFDEEIGGL